MPLANYTAKLTCDANLTIRCLDNDLAQLIDQTARLLSAEIGSVSGFIVDNRTGEVVHQCEQNLTH